MALSEFILSIFRKDNLFKYQKSMKLSSRKELHTGDYLLNRAIKMNFNGQIRITVQAKIWSKIKKFTKQTMSDVI